jgi:Histidine kinase-, DNA gyrase B-, and HSP90-like ATPase
LNKVDLEVEALPPEPAEFIRSIAEQGYRLETAIADLIDNSISADADKVEVILDTKTRPFTLYIADNGRGMDEATLKAAMRFPSRSMENMRGVSDLGRFGLGLKTASFSQTHCFTVMTRTQRNEDIVARTWDLDLLAKHGWALRVENQDDIAKLEADYTTTRESFLGEFAGTFTPSTVVVWKGLHKYENYITEHNAADAIKKELTETTRDFLSIVFHRFMERSENPLQIRLNNIQIKPFNPFPTEVSGVRRLGTRNRSFGEDCIKVEGIVLPTNAIEEATETDQKWTPPNKSLSDLEGVYVYRANRIILYGGWLNLARRSQRLQLARMRVEIGNSADHLLHLNVSKSQIEMPYDLRTGLTDYIKQLREEAEREFFNRTVRTFSARRNRSTEQFIVSRATNRGAQMSINPEFALVKHLEESLNPHQRSHLRGLLRMFGTELNRIRRVHSDTTFTGVAETDGLEQNELQQIVEQLLENGFEPEFIRSDIISQLGFTQNSLPAEVLQILEEKR